MNKQIEEMARDINIADHEYCNGRCIACEYKAKKIDNCTCVDIAIATGLVDKGYRKASDVAREIFAEIEQAIFAHGTKYAMKRLEELKKKYGVTDE